MEDGQMGGWMDGKKEGRKEGRAGLPGLPPPHLFFPLFVTTSLLNRIVLEPSNPHLPPTIRAAIAAHVGVPWLHAVEPPQPWSPASA